MADKTIIPNKFSGILNKAKDLSREFPNGIIFIGGVATFLHLTSRNVPFAESTYDIDLYISLSDFTGLRDGVESVVFNEKFQSFQLIQNRIVFDVYVENNHSLSVNFNELMRHSTVINEVRASSPGHLLILKLDAYKDRKYAPKGHKDARDIIGLMAYITPKEMELAASFLTPQYIDLLEEISRRQEFRRFFSRINLSLSRQIMENYEKNLAVLKSMLGMTATKNINNPAMSPGK